MNMEETYLATIRRVYPDLDIISTRLNDQGQNNVILVINSEPGEYIFRFPRYSAALERLQVETALLTGLQERISLPIPKPFFLNLDAPVGQAFMGYRSIPGEPLWRPVFRAIQDEDDLQALADQLGTFLRQMHQTPANEIAPRDLPRKDTYEENADIYARMRAKLFPYMRADACEWTSQHFESFLGQAENFSIQVVLKHGDFGPSNILFNNNTKRVQGIIDFGGSGLGDPAYDFAGLLSGYGEPFVQRCARTYLQAESFPKAFFNRIRFYQGTFALLEALFGIENDDPQAFKAGIQQYI